ncbi:MAG: energy-coupling factor ABC transporter ATP-binding protein [Treponema sp.]|nr:energy-coupling factor ABC transporter ATP-binding protein [Treponema sp.]
MKAVEIDLKSFRYFNSPQNILENLKMQINYGEITLLSGFSGCGKSTLLSLINGVIPRVISGQIEGDILIDGENINGKTMSQISRKVGSVLQNAESQIIHQQVEDEIAFACENLGFEREKIQSSLDQLCPLLELGKDWKCRSLSGGQKQRLVTASTLAMETPILIFDEPFANLDLEGAKKLLDLLTDLKTKGKAILLVEHRLDLVLPYVDKIWSLENKSVKEIKDKETYLKSQTDIIKDEAENKLSFEDCLLEIKDLKKSFAGREILKGISCKIYRGERILLCGQNGCGKTTLLSIIGRLQKADSGQIIQNINPKFGKRAGKKWFKAVGIVYQNPNYQLFMSTVKDEILFGAEDKNYALDLAHKFELDEILERHPHSLSEGQKRRVTIAAILAQRPKLLLLDEPTVGQDYGALKKMMKVLNEIHRQENNTMITITHDIRCISALCDRKIHIQDGIINN